MPNYYNPYQYYPQPMQQSIQQAQQIQNNGFISVRNESEARNYPVAPGNSITFKDENAPYVYTKTMGFSQLDRPSFEKYKLIKEDISDIAETVDVDSVKADIDKLWGVPFMSWATHVLQWPVQRDAKPRGQANLIKPVSVQIEVCNSTS